MSKLSKVIRDFRGYLSEIDRLAKPLDEKQTEQLTEILTSLMVLLVALRQTSHLGEYTLDLKDLE